jgi:4-hydroxy-3-methylbut-2-enyl diphosphate reductase
MKVIRAESLGMCFGVRDAIALARDEAEAGPLTVLGDLVHNTTVLADLEARGIVIAREAAQVKTPTVMVTAHGASQRTLGTVRNLGLRVVEATCPLVDVAHRAVAALVRDGYHPVIVGQRTHVEVRGMTEDLIDFDVVLDETDVRALAERPRLGIVAQTTQPIERVRDLVALVRRRFPQSDVRMEWFRGAGTVGITAGTSTPDAVIERVELRIRELAAADEDHIHGRAERCG